NPEVPFNYQLLTKLKRLDPLTGFKTTDAPRGKFFNAKSLYLEHYDYAGEKLNAYNGILKQYYLKNFLEVEGIKFVSGTYKVESVRELLPDDVFPHGIAVRLQADDFPAAHVDFVLPCPADFEIPAEHFRVGDVIQIQESATCAALIHVEKMEEDHFCFTAVPLVIRKDEPGYTLYDTPAGTKLQVAPPERLHLGTGRWPISDDPGLVAKPLDEPEPDPAGEQPEAGTDSKDDAPPADKPKG
ncbi:MAG: hypothetical protein KDM64_17030, partial [Verrucomicrobiae bacterium]|nr:hypothetical protein [Verrucomicrobiae bacterium]